LPGKIIRRPKQKFSQGTGSADLMADYAHQKISDSEFAAAKQAGLCRSKEELLYYKIFKEQFGAGLHADVIGQTRSITASELH
jgi:asparagine synthase (glutamine-hydrolysing)